MGRNAKLKAARRKAKNAVLKGVVPAPAESVAKASAGIDWDDWIAEEERKEALQSGSFATRHFASQAGPRSS